MDEREKVTVLRASEGISSHGRAGGVDRAAHGGCSGAVWLKNVRLAPRMNKLYADGNR